MKRLTGFIALLAVAVLLVGCGGSSTSAQNAGTNSVNTTTGGTPELSSTAPIISGNVTVFAAASLTEAFTDMKKTIEAANPGTTITLNFAGSSNLRTQIMQGARADVFASADAPNMDQVVKAGDISGQTQDFVQNRLVVLLPKGNPAKITRLQDLAKPGLKLVLAQEQVPVGNYARQVLAKLSADPAYGTDFEAKVLANLASNELNVKDVVAKVQLGEADAGIVYASDVTPSVRVATTTIDIPDQFNVVANYPIGVVKSVQNPDGARAFITFVLSPAGQAVLQHYGFIPISGAAHTP